MENCSVKQYRTTVDNPSLEYFDALQFRVDFSQYGSYDHSLVLRNTTSITIGGIGVVFKILSNGYIYKEGDTDPVTEYTMNNTAEIRYIKPIDVSKPTEFLLIGLQKITKMRFNYTGGIYLRSPKNLVMCRNLTQYYDASTLIVFKSYPEQAPYDSSYIADLAVTKANITTVKHANGGIMNPLITTSTSTWKDFVNLTLIDDIDNITSGDISILASLTKLTGLYLMNPGVTGVLSSVGGMTALTRLNLNGSSVRGSIEDFVAAQYSAETNPRKSASGATRIRMYFNDSTNITLNGTKTTISGKYLAWDDGGSAPSNIRFENS